MIGSAAVHRHTPLTTIIQRHVLALLMFAVSTSVVGMATQQSKNRGVVPLRILKNAGNRIYRVHVELDPTDRSCGTWTATTGVAHPAGAGLNILYGSNRPGFPFTSNTVLRSYTSTTDYATGDSCTKLCGVVSPAIFPIMSGSTEVGYRMRWSFSDKSQWVPSGPSVEFEQEVMVVGPVDGTETVDNTVIRETHTIRNFGPGPFRFGLRKLWDWQIGDDDGPFFGSCETPTQACDASMNLVADDSSQAKYPAAYVINSDPSVTSCPAGITTRAGNCDGVPPYLVAGTVTPSAGAGLSPPPTAPELLQFNRHGVLFGSCWQPVLTNGALCGALGDEGGDDTAVAYFYGLTPASAITLGINEERSFTQYVAAARNTCPGIISPRPSSGHDPCCPPWNSSKLQEMLVYQGSGGIAASYTLRFQPSSAFLKQIQAYIDYLHASDPAITSISIHFRVLDAGAGASPVVGPALGLDHFATWTAGGGGQPTSPIDFFTLVNEPLEVNHWYRIHTGIFLNDGKRFFADGCAVNGINARLQLGQAVNGDHASVLQMQVDTYPDVAKEVAPRN